MITSDPTRLVSLRASQFIEVLKWRFSVLVSGRRNVKGKKKLLVIISGKKGSFLANHISIQRSEPWSGTHTKKAGCTPGIIIHGLAMSA